MTGGQRRKVVVSGKATKSSPKVSTARKLNRKLNDGELGGSKKTGKIVDKEEVSDITDTGEDSDVSTSQGVDRSGLQTWRGAGKKGKRTKQVIYVCKGGDVACNEPIKTGEVSIQCEACDNWFHPACQGLSKEAFGAVVEHDLFWVCDGCRKCFSEQRSTRKQVKRDIDQAETRIMEKVEEVRSLVEKAIVKKVDDGLKKMEMKIGESSSALKRVVQEKNIDRKKNLIRHNIPESCHTEAKVRQDHDMKEIGKITDVLCGNENKIKIVQAFRLNRRKDVNSEEIDRRPRLLMVKVEREEDVENLLKKRFELRDAGYPNVYITRDQSKEERERQWKLREELKKKGRDTHRIFRGQIVPRDQ